MKTSFRTTPFIAVILSVMCFAGWKLAHAQDATTSDGTVADTNVDWSSASDFEVELKALEMTTPVSATSEPMYGTFYSAQYAEVWPPLPANILGLPVWPLGDDFFVLDDTNVNYASLAQSHTSARRQMAGGGRLSPNFNIADFGTNLWLEITNLANNTAGVLISNTQPDIEYEIQGKANLTDAQWVSEGFVLGSEITNWTSASVTVTNYPNLFLRIRSWADDGSGLPIWWQLQYFGTTGVDPNANPAGDGWSNIQKFQNGMNPNQFYTPPAPQGLTANYDSADSTATVSWQPSPGAVTGYTVEKDDNYAGTAQDLNFSAATSSFEDNVSTDEDDPFSGDSLDVSYKIEAQYGTNGTSAWGGPATLGQNTLVANFIAGPQGSAYLAVPILPAGTVTLQVTRLDETALFYDEIDGDHTPYLTNFDISVTNSTNGMYLIPSSWCLMQPDAYGNSDAYDWTAQTLNTNGTATASSSAYRGYSFVLEDDRSWLVPPYFDGRVQLKQNLIFLLRAAVAGSPFDYDQVITNGSGDISAVNYFSNPTGYEYAGFYELDENANDQFAYEIYGSFDAYWPFENNDRYENFVFNSANLNGYGRINTGVGGNYAENYLYPSGPEFASGAGDLYLLNPQTYQFQPPATNDAAISAVLATNQTRWLCSYAFDSPTTIYNYLSEIGITNEPTDYVMFSNAKNYFGLSFLSAEIGYGSGSGASTITLSAGGNTTQGGYFYPETTQPKFQTVEYDFWNPVLDSLPGITNFSTTNISRLMITTVDNPNFQVVGYAKLTVTNSYYSGVYGYLGQYFTNAYEINTNGVVTTNSAGLLSPYGYFFPTNPGPAALVTMPDPDTGAQGTCTVYAVSLALDANHDGFMDTSFGGADTTSQGQPFTFWANNNFDRWHTVDITDSEQDDLEVVYGYNGSRFSVPDCNYTNAAGYRAIPCSRDLEDFTRLWINGVTSNLLAALPSGSTITLNWGDVGSPNSANPTIDLFTAADADGGIGYLTNATIAAEQTNLTQCPFIGRLAPGGSLQLNTIQFNNWAGNHFIWCGVSNGTGGLTMTIADGNGNVLAQTTAYIQIVDIKQMYERYTVGDNPNLPVLNVATNASDGLPIGTSAFQYTSPPNTNTPYILFVHGWNQPLWEKDRFAETAFKRLYWQGFQGRFGEFRWPTYYDFPFGEVSYQAIDTRNFDNSESNAWASAVGLLNKLTDLNSHYPGKVYLMAHSMGNVVAGEALRLAGTNQVVNTYAAMQGAIASQTYDPTTPTRPLTLAGVNYDNGTPNRYAQYPTNGGPSYFNGSAGAGTYVNFFNTNDWALMQLWEPDQDFKPDNGGLSYPGYFYSVSSQHPNGFYYQFGSGTNDFHNLNFPGDTYTIFSYCDEARCHALGAQINVGGKFAGNQVELDGSPYNFGPVHKYHSGEFRSDNAQRWQFWDEVLVDFELKSP